MSFFVTDITDVNRSAAKCSMEYVEGQLSMKIESIKFSVIICQNEDKSGFRYHNEYTIENYTLGQDLEQRLNCTDDADCESFAMINELLSR